MSTSDAHDVIQIALAAATPQEIDPDKHYALTAPEGSTVEVVGPQADKDRANPRRPQGTSVVYDVDALEVLWKKHSQSYSEVFASVRTFNIEAVLNADAGAGEAAGHRDHRIQLVLEKTPGWLAWLARDGKLFSQEEFAQFLEDRLPDVVDPPGAAMLEIATTIQQLSKVDFKSATVLGSGARQFKYEETANARAGQKGELEIPAEFTVALQPFEASPAYKVQARFRYRIFNGDLSLGFRLDRPEQVIRGAFDDVVARVTEAVGQPVLLGEAPPAR